MSGNQAPAKTPNSSPAHFPILFLPSAPLAPNQVNWFEQKPASYWLAQVQRKQSSSDPKHQHHLELALRLLLGLEAALPTPITKRQAWETLCPDGQAGDHRSPTDAFECLDRGEFAGTYEKVGTQPTGANPASLYVITTHGHQLF